MFFEEWLRTYYSFIGTDIGILIAYGITFFALFCFMCIQAPKPRNIFLIIMISGILSGLLGFLVIAFFPFILMLFPIFILLYGIKKFIDRVT